MNQIRKITLFDIAQHLGISLSSVSRALHNSSSISLKRRQQIQKVALQMGYQPNPMASALAQQRYSFAKHPITAEIAWINYWNKPEQLRSYREFDLYWKGACARAAQSGYRLEEFTCHHQFSPARLEEILLSRNIHGILIPPHNRIDLPSGWSEIRWEKFNVVRLGYSVEYPCADVVTSNHVTTGISALENMRRLGYRRIGLVINRDATTRLKSGLFAKQVEMTSKQQLPPLVLQSDKNEDSVFLPLLPWIKKYKPDSILTDIRQLRRVLERAGYRIPQDIGLAAASILDGNADAGIYQNSEAIGYAACELLIEMVKSNRCGISKISREVLIAGEWVDGSTLPHRVQSF